MAKPKMSSPDVWQATLGMIILGLLLIMIGQVVNSVVLKIDVGSLLANLGSFIAVVGVLNWLYEMFARRKFFQEMYELLTGSHSLFESGLSGYTANSLDVKFRQELAETTNVLTLFSYNSRFLSDYQNEIQALLSRGGKANFIFLSEQSRTISTMKSLGWESASMTSHYRKIESFARAFDTQTCKPDVTYIDAIPRYSAVKLDARIYIILGTTSNHRQHVPALCVKAGSPLYQFFSADLDAVRAQGVSK